MSGNYRHLSACIIVVVFVLSCEAQLLDRLLGVSSKSSLNQQGEFNETSGLGKEIGSTFRRMMNSLHSVNVPMFYDMNKNGSSMGINVLSGLVKVERGAEAERNGLAGSRPLSVRVFGVPVYERGQRVRPPPSSGSEPLLPGLGRDADRPETGPEEELPIDP